MQILGLWDTLNNWSLQFKNFIFDNSDNPLLWIGIVVIGFLLFKVVFNSLNKD